MKKLFISFYLVFLSNPSISGQKVVSWLSLSNEHTAAAHNQAWSLASHQVLCSCPSFTLLETACYSCGKHLYLEQLLSRECTWNFLCVPTESHVISGSDKPCSDCDWQAPTLAWSTSYRYKLYEMLSYYQISELSSCVESFGLSDTLCPSFLPAPASSTVPICADLVCACIMW